MVHFTSFVLFVSILLSIVSITAQTQNQLGSKGTQQCTINNNFYAGSNKKVETVMFEMKKQLDEIQKELRNLTQKTKKENRTKEIHYHKNCADVYKSGDRISGVYTIDPDGSGAFDVYCDHSAPGGGWTVFQKRLDGSVDFYRGWNYYKLGFGNLNGEFWLGLDKIHRLTKSERCKLRVDLEDTAGKTAYAEYDMFAVTSERTKYQLAIGTYSGTAGDSLTYHRGHPFSTKDQDNDNWSKHYKQRSIFLSTTLNHELSLSSKGAQQCTINNNFYAGPNKKVETMMFEMKKQLDEIQKELRNLTQKTKKESKTKVHLQQLVKGIQGSKLSSDKVLFDTKLNFSFSFPSWYCPLAIHYRKNCGDVYKSGDRISGVYTIDPDGWTVFQKRLDGSVDFSRGWNDYKLGFGNLNGEFWLGLDIPRVNVANFVWISKTPRERQPMPSMTCLL
ncbi:unnamed protein product [Porites evermanni]|uniref:Fibrinogen C-terminal domain-containing protein n=1 Tax=Porites evermanni TaxID=104178 RepID=A0ABN8LAG8_9CNID|nr:unnamed protein product [Porites evermanni]